MINLNCEAQMEQLVNFMYNMENSSSLLSIEKYQLAPKAKDPVWPNAVYRSIRWLHYNHFW
ncbi:MAG: hypothetical protein COV73_05065 [Candidatus Omnitrophica bacterium CG11_big_fil_rev_8_21_14_0_20_43_6]|nr:MAG: hypothetical protein COV73_05065 [Candidatus Omnitrophica bacterium CG11_big_fil_rev_8_21_14_0_20_43_6]